MDTRRTGASTSAENHAASAVTASAAGTGSPKCDFTVVLGPRGGSTSSGGMPASSRRSPPPSIDLRLDRGEDPVLSLRHASLLAVDHLPQPVSRTGRSLSTVAVSSDHGDTT